MFKHNYSLKMFLKRLDAKSLNCVVLPLYLLSFVNLFALHGARDLLTNPILP